MVKKKVAKKKMSKKKQRERFMSALSPHMREIVALVDTEKGRNFISNEVWRATARIVGRYCKAQGNAISAPERGLLADILLDPIITKKPPKSQK